jgi:SAM-dependent methyltransferase
MDRPELCVLLARYLVGDGVELGPGHSPFPLPFPGTTVRYVDRWVPDANRELFPELVDAEFPMPDIVADLDADRLGALNSESQDFVVASHVLEHMANPLALVDEIHRVLRPGGVALLLLPDRRRTFDYRRDPTPLAHLVAEYQADVESVSEEHVEDFLRGVGEWDDRWSRAERERQIDHHRQRSIHVHCWNQDEFPELLVHAISELGMHWELVDAVFVEDVAGSIEFGYVLRRALYGLDAGVAAARFRVLRNRSLRDAGARSAEDSATSATPNVNGDRSWYRSAAVPLVRVARRGRARIRNRFRDATT